MADLVVPGWSCVVCRSVSCRVGDMGGHAGAMRLAYVGVFCSL